MIPALRQRFNRDWTPEKYARFLARLDERCGTKVKFRISETPCFFPRPLLERMAGYGRELVEQLLANREYMRASDATLPFAFTVPNENSHPLFVQADFGLVRSDESDAIGGYAPKLVEIQAFPSLYAYQAELAECYREVYDLNAGEYAGLRSLPGDISLEEYWRLLRRAILADCTPEEVILLEIDPLEQKTLPDFVLTEKRLGIRTVNLRDVHRDKRALYYERDGRRLPIRRIYNRAIVDEIVRKGVRPNFSFRDELDVEWAGHPNWYFRISKFSIPWFHHVCVPRTWFLDKLPEIPGDLENFVLKPLYSFAGLGVVVGPTRADIDAVSAAQRSQHILQERMNFEPVMLTPAGPTKVEVRVMYLWLDALTPVNIILRTGRGAQMGVDFNRNLDWVGASAAFWM